MSPRKIGEVLVPSIVISILIVLVAANQVVQSAPVDRVPDIHTEFTVDQQSASTALLSKVPNTVDAQLTVQSSIEEIQSALLNAYLHYETLHVIILREGIDGAIRAEDVWLSQPLKSFHQTTTIQLPGKDPDEFVTVSDGIFTSVFLPEAGENVLFPANVEEPPSLVEEHVPGDTPVIVPNWFESMVPTVAMLVMPGDFARIDIPRSDVSILGEDVLLGRSTVVLHVLAEGAGGYNLWLDASTGIILKAERIAYDGVITYSFTVTELELNPKIDPAMFYVDHTAYDPQRLEELLRPTR